MPELAQSNSFAPTWIVEAPPAFRVEPFIVHVLGLETRRYAVISATGEQVAEAYHADAARVIADAFIRANIERPKGGRHARA